MGMFAALFSPRPAVASSELEGFRCEYLIGTDKPGQGKDGVFTVVSYDVARPLAKGKTGAYVNLLVENFKHLSRSQRNRYGPYLKMRGTAAEYQEGVSDPRFPGWELNLRDQLNQRSRDGFTILGDIDNIDSFRAVTVKRAYDIAHEQGFKFICKNPGLGCSSIEGHSDAEKREDATSLVAHPGVIAIIVERGAGTPGDMQRLRVAAGKPNLPVYFVFFGSERWLAPREVARQAASFRNMSVSHSPNGEYTSSMPL